MYQKLFSPKQKEFILESTAKWNIAHGPVRSGKTVGSLFRFMEFCSTCPDSQLFMVGHTSDTIYQNAVRLLLESDQMAMWRPYCTWFSGKRQVKFMDKTIQCLGAKDEGAIGQFQGKTMSGVYCDEMTLYPESIIDMIDTRLSMPYSMGFASMNPSHPHHKLKQWIDKAEAGDKNYYALQFMIDDNPFLTDDFKQRLANSLSGLFYKRNYLGLWCLAEGAIFDFFDPKIHVVQKPPRAADYFIAAIDYGVVNPFCCLIIGVSTGKYTQTGKCLWVEKEYYYDPKKQGRQKVNSEFADEVAELVDMYGVKQLYIDPSAEAMQIELRRRSIPCVHANNDVDFGIQVMTREMKEGNIFIMEDCPNLIREIQSYVWDSKAAERGWDQPLKRDDHACVTADTLIKTIKGNIPIVQLVGQEINVVNVVNGQFEINTAVNVKKTGLNQKIYKLTLENGKTLRATEDHKIYTKRGYIQIQSLLPNDLILTVQYNNIRHISLFTKITKIEEDGYEDVYCMYVPETNQFIANDIVVHNCDALRYALASHKVTTYQETKHNPIEYQKGRFDLNFRRGFF